MELKYTLKLYKCLFWMRFKKTLMGWQEILAHSFFLAAAISIFAAMWQTMPVQTGDVSFSSTELIWYIALNEWVLVAVPLFYRELQLDISSLEIESALLRPTSYLLMKFSEGLGELYAYLIALSLPAFAIAWIWTRCCPLSAEWLLLSFILGFVGGTLGLLCHLCLGLLTFWLEDVTSLFWVSEKVLLVFGGLFLPLTVYPNPLPSLCQLLPSYAILGGRSALVMNPSSMPGVIFSAIFWMGLLWWLAHYLWRLGIKKLGTGA